MSLWTWLGSLGVIAAVLHSNCGVVPLKTKPKHKNGHISRSTSPRPRQSPSPSPFSNSAFDDFQSWYIIIVNLARLSDWMLGPFVYQIYAFYLYSDYDKAVLFVFGYLTSGIFGIFIGSLADRFGRKRMCSLFCILFASSSLIMAHFGSSFVALLCGRLLSGISTSILHSVYESWMVTHHHLHQYAPSALHQTFETAQSVNSIIAIFAGIIGSYSISIYKYYDLFPFSPRCAAAFHFSVLVLVVTFVLIQLKWIENYGFTRMGDVIVNDEDSSDSSISTPSNQLKQPLIPNLMDHGSGLFENITRSLEIVLSDPRIFAVGVIQSGFESALYIFIFLWTKSLDEVLDGVPFDHGMVFAIMMMSCFIGTRIVTLIRMKSVQLTLRQATLCSTQYLQCIQLSALCVICAVALFSVPLVRSFDARLWLIVVQEICVGGYRPLMSSLRSQYVPHQYMATILSLFRVPLNAIVVVVLVNIERLEGMVFQICALLLTVSSLCAAQLAKQV